MSEERTEFTWTTRQLLATRAGWRCSFLGCSRQTVGPGATPNSKQSIGMACHIFSAAPGGPRGQNGLTPEQLESHENGIWLCRDHGTLIDNRNGADYPAAKLQSFKALHEARILRELNGEAFSLYWLERMTIRWNPLFEPNSVVVFGKVTVIAGSNFLGKSALCDWIAGFGDQRALWRWLPKPANATDLDIELRLHQAEAVNLRMQVRKLGGFNFSVNGQPGPIQPLQLHFVYLHEEWDRDKGHTDDDAELVWRSLNVEATILPNLFPLVDANGLGFVRNLRLSREDFSDDGDTESELHHVLYSDVQGTAAGLPFRGLSQGEQQLVLIELAVAMARYSAQFRPTMLILDGGMHRFPEKFLVRLIAPLLAQETKFQTVVVLPRDERGALPQEWTMVRLDRGAGGDTTITEI